MKNHYRKTPPDGPPNLSTMMATSYQPSQDTQKNVVRMSRQQQGSIWKKSITALLFMILGLIITIVVWDFRNFSVASKKLFGTDNAWEVVHTTPLKTDLSNRTNIILVGYSVDDPGHTGAKLTDSILVLSIDNTSHTGYMLNIPRDLYVEIPNYGYAKINEAYQAGEYMKFREASKPDGGMGLLQKVVSDTLGIKLQYYALINYSSVKEVVDALGGVQVTINSSDKRGIYDPNFPKFQGGPLKLTNGTHHIDGQTALRLTRARGSTFGSYGFPNSDFNRTQNQQQVFIAMKDKLDWKLVLDPRINGKIFAATGSNINTDLTINEVIPFYRLLTATPNKNIKSITLNNISGKNLLTDFTTPASQSALIPSAGIGNYTEIKDALNRL